MDRRSGQPRATSDTSSRAVMPSPVSAVRNASWQFLRKQWRIFTTDGDSVAPQSSRLLTSDKLNEQVMSFLLIQLERKCHLNQSLFAAN